MTVNSPKVLAQTNIATTSQTTVYTVPSDATAIINNVTLTNISANSIVVDIDVGDSGSERSWRKDMTITASETIEFNGAFILEANDVVKITVDTSSALDVLMTGLEVK